MEYGLPTTPENPMAGVCKYCGKQFDVLKGRADRQFCDERCKNAYHNAKNREFNEEFKRVQAILNKNRKILKLLVQSPDRAYLKRFLLESKGFNFHYYTHQRDYKGDGNPYCFCYEFGYKLMGPAHVKVVQAFDHHSDEP